MALHTRRRLLCLVTALLFAISSVAHVYAATDAMMKMEATLMVPSAPVHDMDCDGNNKASTQAACVAMCATAVAIVGQPIDVGITMVAHVTVSDAGLPLVGRSPSPELHPPKR